ncbi:MAG TPA: Uma2 family endonuclease [Candidatus Kapabacteria bacterium]|jgi:Uma2 family endonuclease|nr:Uma2 family endonuclease [Candidatus Kapabacteria bacterium]
MLLTKLKQATVEDYERLPEGAPYQLIGGELIMSPSPNFLHQRIVTRLVELLSSFARSHKLGEIIAAPMDVYLTNEDVYQPDILFIRQDRVTSIDPNDRIRIAPDLVIEVLSPSTAYYDFTRKKEIYCQQGVEEYWIVDPEDETIEIMVKDGTYYRTEALLRKPAMLHSAMFPEFTMKMEEVFAF